MLVRSAWWVGAAVWFFWTVKSIRELPALLRPRTVADQPDRFVEAQAAYLRSDWESAEQLLLGTLAIEPRDPPALLLLSGVYRHTDRVQNADVLVDEIRRLEVADPWQIEIAAEAARVLRDRESSDETEDRPDSDSEPEPDDSAADLTAA
jgi:hypothetical protein